MKYIDFLDVGRGSYTKYDDEAWSLDGSANDEGYHFKWCSRCRYKTEHELDECLSCESISRRCRRNMKTWQEW